MAPVRFTHPDDRAEIRTQLERLQTGESQVCRLNMRYVQPDGTVIWVSLTASPVNKVADAAAPRLLFIV